MSKRKGSSLDEAQRHLRKLSKRASLVPLRAALANKPTSAKAATTRTKKTTKMKTLREHWKETGQ